MVFWREAQMQSDRVCGKVGPMRASRAFTAAFAVAVLVGTQLAALAHTAAVRHAICEEHGEQIEVANPVGPVDECPQGHVVGATGRDGGHEHCQIARLLSSSLDPTPRVPVVALATFATDVTVSSPSQITAALDLVLIAPKTSPPR
jgi:hypothetical protein